MEVEEQLSLQPSSVPKADRQSNHTMLSHLWVRLLLIATTVKSILGLIILFLLLVISITVLVIGSYFKRAIHCPIAPNLSLFLIIAGSMSIKCILLSMILSIIVITLKHIRSYKLINFIIIIGLIIIFTNIFSFIWVIFGSIWTLEVLDTVQYTNSHINTYCQQTLYRCTLVYLVLTYILFALTSWYRFCIVIFCSIQE